MEAVRTARMRELRVAMAEEDEVMANIVGGGECRRFVRSYWFLVMIRVLSEKHVNLMTTTTTTS